MRHVAVLARAPSARGKTRLTAELPDARARALRAALLADTLEVVASTGEACTVFVTPPEAQAEVAAMVHRPPNPERRGLSPSVMVAAQGEGELGHRMHAAMEALFAAGADRVVLVGSDLPSLPASRVTAAFAALDGGSEPVLGPAEDGGYYLIALTRSQPRLFERIAWGGNDVLRQTLEVAARAGMAPALIDPWYDVDVADDLHRVIDSSAPAPAVRAWFAAGE